MLTDFTVTHRWTPFSGSASCDGNMLSAFGPCQEAAVATFRVGGFILYACEGCLPRESR